MNRFIDPEGGAQIAVSPFAPATAAQFTTGSAAGGAAHCRVVCSSM
jgi:hypothetical protein